MASKLSDLSALAATDLAPDADLVYVVDVSAGTSGSKKMTVTDLLTGRTFTTTFTVTGTSASLVTAGADGATNPVVQVDASTASVATGLKLKGAAAAGGMALSVISSGTNENLTLDAKGSGTIGIGTVSTGAITLGAATGVTGALTGTSTSASALAVGRQGATAPVLQVDASTASVATGIKIKGAAAAGGCAVSVVTSGTNENLTVDAAGSGTVTLAGTSTGNVVVGASKLTVAPASGNLSSAGSVLSTSATGGVGYATGAGGAVTQLTSRTTTVICNAPTGAITLFSAAGSATPFSFTVTNSAVAATDVIHLSQKSGTDKYTTQAVTAVGAGSFVVTLANASGTTTEQPVFNFAVVRGVTS